jgi:serine/threonine protein kinase
MDTTDCPRDVAIVNLMDRKPPLKQEPGGIQGVQPFSLEVLRERYDAICKAMAIFYPVVFQFIGLLGQGRQGRVFLSLRQGARGCVTEHAIKVFDPGLYLSPEEYWTDMGRIASQISRLQRMRSPHLVQRSTFEETYGVGYSQMEAIDGLDLRRLLTQDHLAISKERCTSAEWTYFNRTLLRRKRESLALQPGVVVYVVRSCLKGLESMHSMDFLHSDVKPGNIMIDRLGTVKLVDFGRAVVVGEKQAFLLGSPMYMAPELHMRGTSTVQSDLYSLGLVAIEMLRGERLAPENSNEETLLKAKLALPEQLERLLPADVVKNAELTGFLRRMTDPEPANRYPTAGEAEVGDEGLRIVDKQLVQAGLDTEYARDLGGYIDKLVDPKTDRVEVPQKDDST